jgi:hypothetical protein
MSEWRKLDYDKDIQIIPPGNYFLWDDCTCCIKCLCGEEIVLDDQNGPTECSCGKTYKLVTSIHIKEND